MLQAAALLLLLTPLRCAAMSYSLGAARAASGARVNVLRLSGLIAGGEWGPWSYYTSLLDPALDTLIVVDSPGGAVPGGFFLLGKVEEFQARQAAAGRKVAVLAARDCSSMCIPVFYFFDRRMAEPDARFGFHGISLGGLGYDPEQTALYLGKLRDKAKERGDGRVGSWLSARASEGVFSSADLKPIAARALAAQDSGLLEPESVVADEQAAIDALER